MKPHVHCELIKLWADGAEIEYQLNSGEWISPEIPTWNAGIKYRLKKEKKKYRVAKFRNPISGTEYVAAFYSEMPCKELGSHFVGWLGDWIEYE